MHGKESEKNMRMLELMRRRATKFDLVAEYLNKETLKVYSPKYFFDSWLIRENNKTLELWHMSKSRKSNFKKCSYHLQSIVPMSKGVKLLRKIESHNEYTAFHKKYKKINLVDRVLCKGGKRC